MNHASLPLTRRRTVVAGAIALAVGGLPLVASAQSGPYPNKTIQVVVPFPAGGIVDNVTRKLGTELSASLGQTLVVEN
ncbi:MAG: tripartite tricarboxylate transporter substrate binding protein, partial [Ferrovibrionaceae bacterium]